MSFNITNPIIGLKNQLFTGNGTFLVPQNVYTIWVDGTSSGAGGAGGFNGASGGGGGGGCSGQMTKYQPMAVTPGETVTIVIGAQTTAASVGSNGGVTNATSVVGALEGVYLGNNGGGGYGFAGTATNGGGQYVYGAGNSGPIGGGTAGFPVYITGNTNSVYMNRFAGQLFTPVWASATGGGPSSNGGSCTWGANALNIGTYTPGGTALTTQGGGGTGGSSFWGVNGAGGNGGAAGADGTGYGAGGGGGGAGGGGGKGSQGFARIYWQG